MARVLDTREASGLAFTLRSRLTLFFPSIPAIPKRSVFGRRNLPWKEPRGLCAEGSIAARINPVNYETEQELRSSSCCGEEDLYFTVAEEHGFEPSSIQKEAYLG